MDDPCLWVSHDDFGRVDEQIPADSSVDEVVEIERFGDEGFYQVEWSEEVKDRINKYIDKSGSLLEAHLNDGSWMVVLRFASRDQFDTFCNHLKDKGYSFNLLGISETVTPRQGYRGLTPAQRDALVTAASEGYFRVPRETTIEELADSLDVSHQTVSELLRRGIQNLVFATLTAEDQRED